MKEEKYKLVHLSKPRHSRSIVHYTLVTRRGPNSTYAERTHGNAQTCDILYASDIRALRSPRGHTAYGQLNTNRQCVHGPNMGKIV